MGFLKPIKRFKTHKEIGDILKQFPYNPKTPHNPIRARYMRKLIGVQALLF